MNVEKRISVLRRRRRVALENYAKAVREATADLDVKLERIDARLGQLEVWAQDPVVLVRNGPGPAVEVYHGAARPCGKVNPVMVEQGRFDEMPLGEAVSNGLRPCSACARQLTDGAA